MKPAGYSSVGNKLSGHAGITELMQDLGEAMSGANAGTMRMLGGGNPAAVPEAQALWRRRLGELLADSDACDRMLVNYDGPAGSPVFREQVAECLGRELGWKVSAANVAITAGAQSAFFQLFNLFAGCDATGTVRKIVLPISPEYIGYTDQLPNDDAFSARRPIIEEIGTHDFKYHVDFENLKLGDDTGAVCVSRPTNPSGNVLSDEELGGLRAAAHAQGVPLIVDNAYGQPFPGAVFTAASPPDWDDDLVMVFSLSKIGLPGLRTGIVVANEEIVSRIASMTAVIGLANNNIGQAVAGPLLASGELLQLSRDVVRPFYEQKSQLARDLLAQRFGDAFPYRVHVSEGAFFLWLWLPELPITSRELYERLKRRNVLVVPGEYFFYGLDDQLDWPHREQCVRLTFSQSEQTISAGLEE
ncbi:MAG: valine--pyruvate transaminase, partial [Bythopirellula sp.]